MKKTEKIITEVTTVVDDFTGAAMRPSGWTLTRRRDGASIDFQSIDTLEQELKKARVPSAFAGKWFPR